MHDGVSALSFGVKAVQYLLDICVEEDICYVIDQDCQSLGRLFQGYEPKDALQDAQGAGDVFVDELPVELTLAAGASRKDSIGEGLGIKICKLLYGKMKQTV